MSVAFLCCWKNSFSWSGLTMISDESASVCWIFPQTSSQFVASVIWLSICFFSCRKRSSGNSMSLSRHLMRKGFSFSSAFSVVAKPFE